MASPESRRTAPSLQGLPYRLEEGNQEIPNIDAIEHQPSVSGQKPISLLQKKLFHSSTTGEVGRRKRILSGSIKTCLPSSYGQAHCTARPRYKSCA